MQHFLLTNSKLNVKEVSKFYIHTENYQQLNHNLHGTKISETMLLGSTLQKTLSSVICFDFK